MKRYEKIAVVSLSTLMICSNLCFVNAYSSPTSNKKQIKADLLISKDNDKPGPRGCCGGKRVPLLKESVDELQKSGILSEKDVKNIDTFIKKERDERMSQVKDQIYNEECTKIDKMVSEKVITKDQGDKLKAAVKENLESCK